MTGGITIDMAAGTVDGDASVGHDTLRSIEAVRGTNFADSYNATGFTTSSINGPWQRRLHRYRWRRAFNEFEGLGGNDTITGNGNTRIDYINATAAVTVDLEAGTAPARWRRRRHRHLHRRQRRPGLVLRRHLVG